MVHNRIVMKTTHKILSPIEPKSGCIATSLKVVGDRWSGLILRDMVDGPRRFSQLQNSLVGISPRTLSQRLDDMEAGEIITKESFHEVPPRIEYTLTDKGRDLVPILRAMAKWGDKYQNGGC